jgi:hypothetical protein
MVSASSKASATEASHPALAVVADDRLAAVHAVIKVGGLEGVPAAWG